MFKLFVFACILAFAAAEAKPGLFASPLASPLAYTSPLAYSNYAYGGSPLTYNNYAGNYAGNYAPYYKSYYSAPLAYAYPNYYY